ncbi:MAG: hypothetical protein WBC47_04425, partial [Dehalococcoidia bacterium]
MITKTSNLLAAIVLVAVSLAYAQEASTLGQKVFLDKKNKYFSMIPPAGWTQKDYEDNRTKVSWHNPGDERVLLRVIAREAVETYEELKREVRGISAQWASRGVILEESEVDLSGTPAIALEGDLAEMGTIRLLFFISEDIHFNCQYAAPTRKLFD